MAATSPSLPADHGSDPKPHWSADLLKQLKELPEWLNAAQLLLGGIGSLAATAVATFALKDWPWAYPVAAVAATVVVLGVVLLLVLKARRSRSGHASERQARAILLGIGPIEHAPLPTREADAQRVLDMVKGMDYRYGVLIGKSGAGKTSLVRAELLPRLVSDGYCPVYLPSSAGDILAATRVALGELFAPDTPLPEGGPRDLLRTLPVEQRQRVILIYDQFDDLLLTDEPGRRTKFVEWVRKCVKDSTLKVRFLFVMRSDVYASMQDLLPSTPGAWSIAHRHVLGELTPEEAVGVLKLVAAQHEAPFARGLVKEIANDLSNGGKVSPVLLQIVASSLKEQGITSKRRYRAIGEAAAILEWYVVEQIQGAAGPSLAHDVLKQLVGSGEWQPGVGQSLESILTALGDPAPESSEARTTSVCKLLARLTSARLVLRNVDGTYGVPHPILHTAVASAVAQVEAEAAPEVRKAVSLLGRYVATYRIKSRVWIPFWDLRVIRRYVPLRIRIEQPAQQLLWKSLLIVRLAQAAIFAVLVSAGLLGGLVTAGVIVPYSAWDDPVEIGMPPDAATGAPNPKVIGFLPGNRRLVLAHNDTTSDLGELYVVDFKPGNIVFVGGQPRATLQRIDSSEALTALAFHPDGSVLASGDKDGGVKIRDGNLQGAKFVLDPKLDPFGQPCKQPAVSYLSFSAGGVRLVVSRCNAVEIWDTVQKTLLAERTLPPDVRSDAIRANPRGNSVALIQSSPDLDADGSSDLLTSTSQVFVWALDRGKLRDVYTPPVSVKSSGVLEIGFAGDDRLVVATTNQKRLMRLTFDHKNPSMSSPDDLGELEQTFEPSETAMSNDGKVIAVTDGQSTWWIWRDRTGAPEVLTAPEWSSSFWSPDGSALLLTGLTKHTLFQYGFRLLHPSRLWSFTRQADPIASLVGSPWW